MIGEFAAWVAGFGAQLPLPPDMFVPSLLLFLAATPCAFHDAAFGPFWHSRGWLYVNVWDDGWCAVGVQAGWLVYADGCCVSGSV